MQPNTENGVSIEKRDQACLLDLLRNETHDVHERLHVHPVTKPLLEHSLTRQHYVHVLRAFYGFHKPLETKAGSYRNISRAAFLKQDLEYLNDKTKIPFCFELPALDTLFKRLGCWYVVEGSSLGSTLIYKHLQKHLGLNAETGARFFYAYGKDTGRNWNTFKAFLNRQNASQEETKQILKGAIDTFSCLEKWLWECHRRVI